MSKPQKSPRPLPSPLVLGLIAIVFYILFVGMYLYFWETHHDYQMLLNRISWCSADAVAITSIGIGIYSYGLYYKASKTSDVQYLNEFIYALKDAGIKPQHLSMVLAPVAGSMKELTDDPEFAAKYQAAMERVTKERVKGLKSLTSEELYELLRSGGLRL